MEQFPDGMHVRLRNRVRGMYLHADEDWVGVSLSPQRASLNTAWRVHRINHDGGSCVLLYGAAYGRYLAATNEPAPFGHRGKLVVQGVYEDYEETAVVWKAVGAGDGAHVILRHISYSLLRANGKHFTWNNDVSVEHPDNQSKMMHWAVEAIPPLSTPPTLHPARNHPLIPTEPPPPKTTLVRPRRRTFMDLFRRRAVPMLEQRTIRYVRARPNGTYNDNCWQTFQFNGRSMYSLRAEVARQVHELRFYNLVVCVKPGYYGRLTPLTGDLPLSQEQMDVIALVAGSPATQELRYPDVHAE